MKNSIGMCFSRIRSGSFLMGDNADYPYRQPHTEKHSVTLTRPFCIQQTTVTVEQWRQFVAETQYISEPERPGGRSWILQKSADWKFQWLVVRNKWTNSPKHSWETPGFDQLDNHPVTCVTWNDAHAFIDWISDKDDRQYRLPTEAEWEYVCRAGTNSNFYFGDRLSPIHAKYYSNLIALALRIPKVNEIFHINRTAPVNAFSPNKWGVFNMHGNVWEWCEDKCTRLPEDDNRIVSDCYTNNAVDPQSQTGEYRILRGGSWAYPDYCCRSAYRRAEFPDYNASGIGFRLAMDAID